MAVYRDDRAKNKLYLIGFKDESLWEFYKLLNTLDDLLKTSSSFSNTEKMLVWF
jgi:hypothetical protein